jgi:hypothetical protein
MANTFNEKELLPDQASLALCHVKTGNPNWMINAAAGREAANCPACGVLSTARHSSYARQLKDLPNTRTTGGIDRASRPLALPQSRLPATDLLPTPA